MNRKTTLVLLFGFLLFLPAAFAADDIDQQRSCSQCGMDRKAYGYSRMLIRYEDGATAGVCSLHCAAQEMSRNPKRSVAAILAADRTTRALTDATKAVWVVGGRKRGVMTKVPKWAFETQANAEDFVKSSGGNIVTWNEVLAAAQEEVAKPEN